MSTRPNRERVYLLPNPLSTSQAEQMKNLLTSATGRWQRDSGIAMAANCDRVLRMAGGKLG